MDIISLYFGTRGLRVFVVNGDLWYVAEDLSKLLGHTVVYRAMRRDGFCVQDVDVCLLGRYDIGRRLQPDTVLLHETDVYYLLMRSRLPGAQRFQEWMFEQVMPEVFKIGCYAETKASPLLVHVDALRRAGDIARQNALVEKKLVEAEAHSPDPKKTLH